MSAIRLGIANEVETAGSQSQLMLLILQAAPSGLSPYHVYTYISTNETRHKRVLFGLSPIASPRRANTTRLHKYPARTLCASHTVHIWHI
jgi:hypothetical protein